MKLLFSLGCKIKVSRNTIPATNLVLAVQKHAHAETPIIAIKNVDVTSYLNHIWAQKPYNDPDYLHCLSQDAYTTFQGNGFPVDLQAARIFIEQALELEQALEIGQARLSKYALMSTRLLDYITIQYELSHEARYLDQAFALGKELEESFPFDLHEAKSLVLMCLANT